MDAGVRTRPEQPGRSDADLRDTVHLPAGVVHRVYGITHAVLVEASTAEPGWREDIVRLEDSYGRTGTTAA
jgi:mannose-6-phosphate isomerase